MTLFVWRGLSGAEVLASPLAPTWLRQLYCPRPSTASRKPLADMDDSDDSEEGSEDEEGDGGGGRGDKAAAAAEVGSAVEGAEAVVVTVGMPDAAAPVKKRDGNVFASRIAAHAECTRRLWRARYLAMRDVRFYFFHFLVVLRILRMCSVYFTRLV